LELPRAGHAKRINQPVAKWRAPSVTKVFRLARFQIAFWRGAMLASKTPSPPEFLLRRNADDTFDSICTVCYLTAATAKNESELHEKERLHQCDGHLP
jgi:hypothetical protein